MSGISMPAAPPAPVTPAPGGMQGGDTGSEPGAFASLMAGLLGGAAPATPGDADTAVTDPALVDPALADPALADAALLAAAGTTGQVAPPAPGTVDPKKGPVLPVPVDGATSTGRVGRPGPAPADGEVPRTYGCTTGVLVKGPRLPGLPALPGQPATTAGTTTAPPATATLPDLPGVPAVPGSTEAGVPAPAAAQPGVPAQAVAAPAPTAPLAAPSPVAPVHAGPSHVPDQVTAQVFPEVAGLVVKARSAGEGVHRITLNLHPETLGDVRVTLVVRGGEMKVSIHAATEAGRIMADSLPELRRLLGQAGADHAVVAVRDTSAGNATMNSADQGSNNSDLDRSGYDAQQQGRDTHGQGARTRDGHHATDGSHRGTRGVLPGPHDPVRPTRPAGVDVTV